MMKYVIMIGGVISGLGKGITTASIGRILQSRGYRVTAIKIDPYLNCDAGTINPFEHGEIFVTDDGGEIDLDMGHYERFLDVNLTKKHNITTGQIYGEVIRRERKGDYLGQTVQIIPHVTDLIKSRVRQVASESNAEICLVEVGGTVGDIESMPFIEAMRQLSLEEKREDVAFVHLTLVPILDVVGEQKTKPTQHSVKQLLAAGISPDILICRSRIPLSENAKRKISLFCNVPERAVISAHDIENVYRLPLLLDEEGLGDLLIERLCLEDRGKNISRWKSIVEQMDQATKIIRIAMVGKYIRFPDTYLSINEALKHAAGVNDCKVEIDWIDAEGLRMDEDLDRLRGYDGILVPGGFGQRGSEGKIAAIKYAREQSIPFLGLCFGFQLAVVEFARSAGLKSANSTEIDPRTPYPVIDLLPEQKKVSEMGGTMRLGAQEVRIAKGSLAFRIYGKERISERHRHRYEVNPRYIERLTKKGLRFSGKSVDGRRMEILELPGHKFFLATQFHPEFKSRPGKPAPVFDAFVKAALERAKLAVKGKTAG
ncbi:MAG: glutamine hydrolyzing CTP synthase [Candidatus Hadarchaeum sp.]|uniref:glutamine hydrolyzing CTP synthase n=1 Tax=Candidatus Hadarchaeum sp. TaxID=2883567 RepID=UPI003D0A49EC